MNCPYCGYEDGYNEELQDFVSGDKGEFFLKYPDTNDIRTTVCPSCNGTFKDTCKTCANGLTC